MVNPEELAICKRRGHEPPGFDELWHRCKWCGIWVRVVRTLEEREDDPPDDEKSPLDALDDLGKKRNRKKNG